MVNVLLDPTKRSHSATISQYHKCHPHRHQSWKNDHSETGTEVQISIIVLVTDVFQQYSGLLLMM